MEINFELYKVFYFVALEKQISAAARRLYISQPAISQSIKQLELKLGGKLFFRTSRGMELTKEGETLFKYIEQAYGLIKIGENKYNQLHELESGELMIGASDTMCGNYLLDYLEKYHYEYPNVKINVTNCTTSETIDLVRKGKVEIGVINMPVKNIKGLDVITIKEIEDCFIYGNKYAEALNETIGFEELLKYPIIALENKSTSRLFINNHFAEKGIVFKPDIELGSIDLIMKFTKIGLGIGCVTKEFIDKEMINKDIFIVKLMESIPKRNIGLVTLKSVVLSYAGKKFLEYLKNGVE
jgi:DNA-binding transcriptional LysR family regulator